MEALSRALGTMFERAGPALLIYLAGADPHAGDRLGRLGLTFDGPRAPRPARVRCRGGAQLPIAVAMAGGYGRNIDDTVEVHLQTVQLAASACETRNRTLAGTILSAI